MIQFPECAKEAYEAAQRASLPCFDTLNDDAAHARSARQFGLREVLVQTLLSEAVSDIRRIAESAIVVKSI